MRDLTNTLCTDCKKGYYRETSLHDDFDGKLHCTNCQKEVKRWEDVSGRIPQSAEGNSSNLF
jgi:hypothetical protein